MVQQLLRPKCLQLDTGRNNFNLVANFRFLAIFQTLKQFRSYLCIRCTLFAAWGIYSSFLRAQMSGQSFL